MAGKPKLKAAVLWKCYECCGYYEDGREDCGISSCSLYHWMPYRKQEPDYFWVGKERKKGKPRPKRPKKALTKERKEKLIGK